MEVGHIRLSARELFDLKHKRLSSDIKERYFCFTFHACFYTCKPPRIERSRAYDVDEITLSEGLPSCSDATICKHPPLFCALIAVIQIFFFFWTTIACDEFEADGYATAVNIYDLLVFKPGKYYQIWRFFTYALLHAGLWHLGFNALVQSTVGTLVEIVLGSLPTVFIYFSGILAGSLVTIMYDNKVNLIGASGGVYAMLAAYIVCILFSDTYKIGAICWITAAIVVAVCDTVFAVNMEYHANEFFGARTAYAAHFGGAITGMTLSCVFKRRRNNDLQTAALPWISAVTYNFLLICSTVLYKRLID